MAMPVALKNPPRFSAETTRAVFRWPSTVNSSPFSGMVQQNTKVSASSISASQMQCGVSVAHRRAQRQFLINEDVMQKKR